MSILADFMNSVVSGDWLARTVVGLVIVEALVVTFLLTTKEP